MKPSKATQLIICSILLAGCHATQKSSSESTQQHRESSRSYAASDAQDSTSQQRARMSNEPAQQVPRASAASQAAAATQPGDAQAAILGTADEAILITTNERQTIRIAPGHQTVLQIEGENLDAVDSVRITDAQGSEVPGVQATLQSSSKGSGTISISAKRGTKVEGPLRLQVLAGNNSVPAPVRIKKQEVTK